MFEYCRDLHQFTISTLSYQQIILFYSLVHL